MKKSTPNQHNNKAHHGNHTVNLESLLAEIRTTLDSYDDIVFAVLYGTAARGLSGKRSDIDIAVAAGYSAAGNADAGPSETGQSVVNRSAAEQGSGPSSNSPYPHSLSPEHKVSLLLDLEKTLGRKVDLLDLATAHGVILTEVLTKGEIIVNKRPLVYAELMKKMLFYNEDMLPNYRMMLRARAEKIAQGN
jgi:predicted nucleotidyltransferase